MQLHHDSMTDTPLVPSVVALGMFDGMHIGHRAVIRRAVTLARENGWQSVVYTFTNHPRSVFAQTPAPLMHAETRACVMRSLGVDVVDMHLFTRETARLSPDDFLQLLLDRYDVRAIVVGSDYTFGHMGAGTVETLAQMATQHNFALCVVPFVMLDGEKVSSTRIRSAIAQGQSDLAHRMLGDSTYEA